MRENHPRSRPGSAARFLVAGVANTAVGYGAILLLELVLHWSSAAANLGGYATGMLVSYYLSHSFTFKSNRPHRSALPFFFVAVGCCYAINLAVLLSVKALTAWPAALAQALAVSAYAVSFYIAGRHFVFRQVPAAAQPGDDREGVA